jgi:hypothetical protein
MRIGVMSKSSRVRVAVEVRVAFFLGLPSCIFSLFPTGITKKNFISHQNSFFLKKEHHNSLSSSSVSSSYGNEQDAHPKELTGLLFKNAFDDDDHIRHKHTTTTTETKETAFKIFSKRLFLFLVLSSKAASAQY